MPVTIYADTLVFINIFVTYLLLVSTAMLCRRVIRRGRILLSSLIGGLYALTILLPQIPVIPSAVLRAAVCVLLCRIACPYRDLRSFLRLAGVFLLVNFLFAGGLFAIQILANTKTILYASGVVYFDLHIPALLGGTVACYLLIRLCLRLCGNVQQSQTAAIVFFQGDKTVHATGLWDTGFQLCDPFSGKPVLLLRTELAQQLVPAVVYPFLRGEMPPNALQDSEWSGRLRLFPFQSAGGSGVLPAFRCANAEITCAEGKSVQKDFYIAVSDAAFRGSSYDALLPDAFHMTIREGEKQHEHPSSHPKPAASAAHLAVRRGHPLHTRSANAAGTPAKKRRSRGPCAACRRR